MTFYNKILNQFYISEKSDIHNLILRIFTIINIGIILFIGIIGFIKSIHTTSFVGIGAIVLLLINLFFSVKQGFNKFSKYFYLIVIAIYSIFLLVHPIFVFLSFYYIFFPLNSFYVLGARKGNTASLFFFPVCIIFIFLPKIFNLSVQLDNYTIAFLIFSYLAIHSIIYIYEFIRHNQNQHLINELNDIKKLNIQKDHFLSNLSHQIRTPLNNIMVVANILNNAELDQKQQDMLDTIQASVNNLVNVVNNISEIPNIETVESSEYHIKFDLHPTIESTVKLFHQQNLENLRFNLNFPDDIKYNLLGNPIRVKQVFLNLFESIIKNKTDLPLEINVNAKVITKTNDKIKILFEIIINQPLRVPIDKTQKQFISPLKSTEKNKILELINLLDITIANRIIENEGEKLSVNVSGNNTKFSFPLNLSIPEEEVETEEKDKKVKLDLKQSNVLLVEDNIINQKIVLLSLKKAVKSIDVANNGKEALDMFGTSKYDIILMDIQMPVMNGIVTTKKIREIESSTNSHTPIIAITANALLGDKENCLSAGMDDYISKPFQIEVLLKKMKNHLENVKGQN